MSDYFKHFPKTLHSNRTAVDITKRTAVIENALSDPYILLPYTVVEDDRPEDVAYYYYGSPGKVWVVYLANNIIDPYAQWPLTQSDFDKMLMKKYAAQSGTTGYGVISWTQNKTINENILYYIHNKNSDIRINVETYNTDDTLTRSEWKPIRIYEFENITNENKRNIQLIDNMYVEKIESDLKELMYE